MEGWPVDPWQVVIYGMAVYFAFRTLVALMVAHKGRILAERAARRAAAIAQIEAEEAAKREEKRQRKKAG
jgi:hypothetical protein